MLIVHVVRQFHPGVGGLENGVRDLVTTQLAAGDRVRVVTLNRLFDTATPQKLPASELLDGIEIVRIPYFGSKRYPFAPEVLRHIKDADLVHVHAIDFFFDYLAWTKPIHGRTIVVSTHGGFFHTAYAASLKRIWFSTVTRFSLKFYSAVIAVSASDYEMFSALRSSGVAFIENGANVDKFRDASALDFKKSILSIGRFSKNKRIDVLVDFMRTLRRHDPDWTLTIAGRPGDLEERDVDALVEHAGLQGAVEVVSSPSDDTVRSLMRKSTFVASSSDYEGFGMAAIEGLSAGLFPLLSGIPPFRRLVARTGLGMIVDYSHPEMGVRRLLKSVVKIASNHAEQRQARMCAAIGYDWAHVRQKFAALYQAALGKTVRTILGIPIQVCDFAQAVELIDTRFEKGKPLAIAFANAHALNIAVADPPFRAALQNALVFNDGIGVDIASRILYGSTFPENLNGTDFTPNYFRHAKHRYRIFLLGASPGTAERAAHRLGAACPRHKIVGAHHGHFDADKIPGVIDLIRRSGANVLLVAMGNPKQEIFLHEHLAATGCVIGIGVGALFDFVAGNVPRAPLRVQRLRLEWLYRLAKEPRRLARRYLFGNPLFLLRIAQQWWSGARVRQAEPDSGFMEAFPAEIGPSKRTVAAHKAMSA